MRVACVRARSVCNHRGWMKAQVGQSQGFVNSRNNPTYYFLPIHGMCTQMGEKGANPRVKRSELNDMALKHLNGAAAGAGGAA